jgi:hypothetical protein
MPAIWVPWRLGATAHEQQKRRQGRQVKGTVKAAQARAQAVKKTRRKLLRDAKAGRITRQEYLEAVRKLDR